MTRLPPITNANLDSDQKVFFDAITGGKRGAGRPLDEFVMPDGAMRGPFNAMMHHPALGNAVQRLGEMLRFEGTLSDILREVAILTVGRHWRAQYEWWAHAKIAKTAGLDDAVIQAIYDQVALPGDNPEIAAVHAFAKELVETQHVSDGTYAAAEALLGHSGIVELVVLCGYYGVISGILNTFEVPLPDGETLPFPKTASTRS